MFAYAPEAASNDTGQEPVGQRPVPGAEILGGFGVPTEPSSHCRQRKHCPYRHFLPALTQSPHILIPAL